MIKTRSKTAHKMNLPLVQSGAYMAWRSGSIMDCHATAQGSDDSLLSTPEKNEQKSSH